MCHRAIHTVVGRSGAGSGWNEKCSMLLVNISLLFISIRLYCGPSYNHYTVIVGVGWFEICTILVIIFYFSFVLYCGRELFFISLIIHREGLCHNYFLLLLINLTILLGIVFYLYFSDECHCGYLTCVSLTDIGGLIVFT